MTAEPRNQPDRAAALSPEPAVQGRRVLAATVAAIALLVGAVVWFAWHEYDQHLETAAELSNRRARALAGDVGHSLQMAAVAVNQAQARLQRLPAGAPLSGLLGDAVAERAEWLAALPLPFEVHALDAQGRAIDLAPGADGHRHDGDAGGVRHLHSRPAAEVPMHALPPASAGWTVGVPLGAPGSRILPLLWPAPANPHGVAAFAVDLDHQALLRRFEGSRVPRGGGVALFRIEPDGATTLLARAPLVEADLGRTVRGPLAASLARAPAGSFDGETQFDGVRRIVAYRRLEGSASGMVVAYAMERAELLAAWTDRLPWIAAITLLLGAGMAWGGWALRRSLGRIAVHQRALERSGVHYRTLADNLPDVVARLDREGRYLYTNAAIEAATGLAPSAFVGKTNAELGMPQHNVDVWTATLRRVFERGASERLEFDYPGPLGTRHWESVVTAEPAVAGAPATALVISRDITERRQAEDARAALDRRLAEVLESMSDGFVSLDRDWRYVAVNAKAGELLGREPASLVGRHIWTEFPEGVGQPFHRAYERAMNEGATVVMEAHYAPWDRWFENRIYPSAEGIAVFFTDVTERRRAADALRDREQRLREAQQLAALGSWELDLRSGALHWSDEVFRIFEIDPARFGVSYEAFLAAIHPDDRSRVDEAYRRSVAGRHDYAITHRLLFADGRIKHVHEQGRSFYADDGTPLRSVGTVQDITARVQAEQALHDNEERLRLALQAARQGLYDLDLRTGEAVVSPEYALMLGHDPAEFRETNAAWRERLHPDDRAAVEQAYEEYVAGRRPDYRVEFRQRMRDGAWKWILSVGRIQERAADGTPLRMLGTHTDLDAIKSAQAAQEAAKQRFETLFKAAPEAISVSELDSGRFLQVNDAFCELFGHARERVLGRTSIELGMWSDTGRRQQVVEQLRGGQVVHGFEGVARRGDGTSIDVLFSAERIDFDGREALLLMFRDISQRKRLESALQASEARLTHLLARAPTVVYTARAEGDFAATYYSPNLPALLGWASQQFVEQPSFWLDHVHPDDRPRVLHDLEALATRDDLVLEYRFAHADGRWLWMRDQLSVQRDAQGRPVELVGAWIDITARREAEDQVRRLAAELEQRVQERTAQLAVSEARYRTIFETVPVAISEEDWSSVQGMLRELRASGVTDGAAYFAEHPEFVRRCLDAVRMVHLNRKALAMHDAGDLAAQPGDLRSFYPAAEDLPQFVGELEALWSGPRLYTAKKSLPSLSGRPLSLMVSVSLPGLDDPDGTALACMVDITEVDRLNAELDQSVAQLRQANKELETFTYSVSHDLKAPLRGIDGYSRLLLSDHRDRLDEEGRQFLSNIRRATQHMGVLIDDLLAYSRLERREVTLAALPLASVVEAVIAPYRREQAVEGVELRVDVPPDLHATGDAQGLAIALRNLVDNAVKFSRDRRPAQVEISARRVDQAVRLAVRDNGPGFDMKFHDRIFAIFQRLHRAEDFPGTGVGLAIVRKATDRMGGRVWAESAPGQGATFFIELPGAPASARGGSEAPVQERAVRRTAP